MGCKSLCPIQVTAWSSGFTLGLSLLFLCVNVGVWLCNSCVAEFIFVLTNFNAKEALVYNLHHVTVVGIFMEAMSIIFSSVALAGVAKMNHGMVLARVIFLPFYMAYELAVFIMLSIALSNCWFVMQQISDKLNSTHSSNLAEIYLRQYVPVCIYWGIQFFMHVFFMVLTVRGHRLIKTYGRLAREKYETPFTPCLQAAAPPTYPSLFPQTTDQKLKL